VLDYAGADSIQFHDVPPSETGQGYKTWYGRGQNFVLAYTEAQAGAVLAREGQVDEYMAFFPEERTIVDVNTSSGEASGISDKLIIVPPGDSRITVKAGGQIIRLFSSLSPDLIAKCRNRDSYEKPHPNIPPFRPWPDPPEGFKLRVYPLRVPSTNGRFGNLYRSTNMMVNTFDLEREPRDPTKLSPHHHDDFEQCSLSLLGTYVHYIRWPWTTNKSIWRDDATIECVSPAMTVIPPPAIHTTQALANPPCLAIDIFSPPRIDFSMTPGWVLNEADYPMPKGG
jgi:hypothetical protein